MDRGGIARERRRRQALEQLEFERDREAALRDQLEEVVTELHGAEVDEAAFGRMAPDEVEIVREAISGAEEGEPFEDEWLPEEPEEDSAEVAEAELARLGAELEDSRRRQRAFEAYLAVLGEVPATPSSR